MNMSRNVRLAVTGGLLYAAVLFASTITSDYDHSADFARLHTYSWGQVKTSNPLYVDRVKQAVNQSLQDKGWQLVTSSADTTVFAVGQVRNEKELETTYNDFGPGWGGGWGWGGWGRGVGGGFGTSRTNTINQPVGNLVIDIFTSADKKLVWRGMLDRDIASNPEKNIKGLNKDVKKMFKNFPPKGES